MSFSPQPGYIRSAAKDAKEMPVSSFTPSRRQRVNVVAVAANVIVPWVVFAAIFAMMSFSVHYRSSAAAWSSVLLGLGLAVAAAALAVKTKVDERDPTWYTFAAVSIAVAAILAAFLGDMNYSSNMEPFYNIDNLNTYPAVSPAGDKGQQLMDAGRVYFTEGTTLDVNKAISFKNLDRYCVAPIVSGSEELGSYDFWAVGINCCGTSTADFRCGEFDNKHARSGLRLMRDDQRPFFRLAVQQAEAAYNIKAVHPLFFYWMQDPLAEMMKYRNDGFKYYFMGIFIHFVFSALCVGGAVFGFSKIRDV
jgi:hypothetical protein